MPFWEFAALGAPVLVICFVAGRDFLRESAKNGRAAEKARADS